MTQIFITLPVADLERSTRYYEAIGLTRNPAMSDHNSACMMIEEGHSAYMLVTREFFQTMTALPLGDPAKAPVGATSIFYGTRDEVDAHAEAGLAAGGTEPSPPSDYGFMYQRGITDPDGHHVEFGWFDPAAATQPA
jgi:predicted lactoylglutathione lyase